MSEKVSRVGASTESISIRMFGRPTILIINKFRLFMFDNCFLK